jgi:hypothetical protein
MTLEVAMAHSVIILLGLLAAEPTELFPLRTDAPPAEWKAEQINEGLPYRWEKGTVHVLAWEAIEEKSDSWGSQLTQILVLKRFDQPTKMGGHRWVLAHLYQHPEDKERPWRKEMLDISPVLPGENLRKLSDAYVFGLEFYKRLPTNKDVEKFLQEARWKPELGPNYASTLSDGKVVTTKYIKTLTAGGVDRVRWKQLFEREVPAELFPELRKASEDKK